MPARRATTDSETLDLVVLLNVLTAMEKGDFSVRMPGELTGVSGKIADKLNSVIEMNESLMQELERATRVVGREGKVMQRATLPSAKGGWRDCVESVNTLIGDLTQPTVELSQVIAAVAKGDLTQRMETEIDGRPLKGEFLRTTKIVNGMVVQLESFASEVTRVSQEVGTEGILGGQAKVQGVAGTWADLTSSVNMMASNLTDQVRNIANVATAIAQGDLNKKVTVEVKGEILDLKNTINTMVDQLSSFASEVTRVAREVGTEGKLAGQADVEGVAGTWKDLTDNVNLMASNLTNQVRSIAEVTTAVAQGDLTKKITVEVQGELLELKNTINIMVDQLSRFAAEVTRVAQEVGTDGLLGGQADVRGVSGTWRDLTDSVNFMASNLSDQVRDITDVATAVANGDLDKKITVVVKGEILDLKNTINTMVDQLSSFASEVTRVAREVGTEGELGGQANVKGAAGTWEDLTNNVNMMASNLTNQVRNIAEVTTAVAQGDLTKKITVEVKGEILDLKNTINTMVDQLSSFSSEVTRVAREVGTEGKLGSQADVRGVSGTWAELTNNVNTMGANLTNQVRNIADVTTAVAQGDLTKKITVEVQGEISDLKNTINSMVDQLSSFAAEVSRVAREVGTEGQLGGQAKVEGVGGTWKDLTDNVNMMASNLTSQVRNIAEVTTAVAQGDLTKKITVEVKGEILDLKNTVNTMVDQLNSFAFEVTRVAREVGTEGQLGGQADVRGVAGTWKDLTDNVNMMASNLTNQVRDIAEVATAIANGDLTREVTVEVKGEILTLKTTINRMVAQLNSFASEVTRVARDVGTEGQLGGQAEVRGVAGTWKDLTDNVNTMANNLTSQVRGIAKVVTAVAQGNLKQKLSVEARGEIADLAETINGMIETLATFADQVTSVAREVGIEGKLGGQARVPGAAGTWRDLTDNVNELAANLTTQVRSIAEVATAVTEGDLTRAISVEAAGEVAQLSDNINQMILTLKDTTRVNQEQDWLKTNLTKFTRMLQGQKELLAVAKMILSELASVVQAQHGAFYLNDELANQEPLLKLLAGYAYRERKSLSNQFKLGEGLVGQCALEQERILITQVPQDYLQIQSGLGQATPANIVVLPIIFENQLKAIIELASFNPFSETHLSFLDQLAESIGVMINTIAAGMRTEELLRQSQDQAQTLQQSEELLKQQQEELQRTNEELEEKANLLADQKFEVEQKNQEVELARQSLEEKAEQLTLTSKYKSEFLANMSHELRTPLNSLLVLAKILTDNPDSNLTPKQIEYAKNIHTSGEDLLALINDILDLSKIESGTITITPSRVRFHSLVGQLERGFQQIAQNKHIEFTTELDQRLPEMFMTDEKRLQQILRNLLSNAFKFTDQGSVHLAINIVDKGWGADQRILHQSQQVIAFAVSDTGIGIPKDKQLLVFEAFQQVDGATTRKYGGTGLGLSISREIARLLGGEIRLQSEPQRGSTFTLFLPQSYTAPPPQTKKAPLNIESEPELATAETTGPDSREDAVILELPSEVLDDRDMLTAEDQSILIVEDDVTFAQTLLEVVREKNFKGLISLTGEAALVMARKYQPDAVLLDVHLPGMNGWTVLDRIKHDLDLRHIPVHIISVDESWQYGVKLGALTYLEKPANQQQLNETMDHIERFLSRPASKLLLVEDHDGERQSLIEMIQDGDVEIVSVATGHDALSALGTTTFDCVVLDLRLPDISGFEVVAQIREQQELRHVPVIVHTGKDLTAEEESELKRLTESIILKDEKSPDRLLDETALFLHRVKRDLPQAKQQILERMHQKDPVLKGKTVLIVDDDLRNIFAVTSLLERHGVEVLRAENGRDALRLLEEPSQVDVVLMDIMMPEMDGYEATRQIRQMSGLEQLPVIALTAKAMKGDREKCIEAGASDYITKPVDSDQLLSLLRVWMYR